MLKLVLPILLLAGVAPVPDQPDDRTGEPQARSALFGTSKTDPTVPDRNDRCDDDPVLVQGVEGDARLLRDPARPDSLKPIHAVDYKVNGCGLLVMTDGSLVRPHADDGPVTIQPAQ